MPDQPPGRLLRTPGLVAALVTLALPGALLAERLGWLTAVAEDPPSAPTPP
jgi:hypothetical protein